MSRLVLAILMAFALLMPFAPSSDAATYENWDAAWFARDQVHFYYIINTTNLQVSGFTCVNNTTQPAVLWIEERGIEIFRLRCTGGETVSLPISNFKFRRIPATDPDDPNSVRYPQDVVIRAGWPAS